MTALQDWTKYATLGNRDAGAIFGERGLEDPYRYALWRTVRADDLFAVPRTLAIIGLNPSKATHEKTDPTITRCIDFAKRWNFTRLVMLNLFAWRETDSSLLPQVGEPVGALNNQMIAEQINVADRVLCAWGTGGGLNARDEAVMELIRFSGHTPYCLAVTKEGHPWHPLYVAAVTLPIVYTPPARPARRRVPGEEG